MRSILLIEQITSYIENLFKGAFDGQNLSHKIVFTIVILLVTFWLHYIVTKYLVKHATNAKRFTLILKSIRQFIWFIAVVCILGIWINAANSVIVVALLIVALVAFSLKNLAMEIVGYFLLMNRRLFKMYDRIEISGHLGDVIKISPLHFKIAERGNYLSTEGATGKIITIPNHVLLEEPIINYSAASHINWYEVDYNLAIDSDWQTAVSICEKALDDYLEEFLSRYSEEQLQRIKAKISLFDGKLDYKVHLLIDKDMAVLSCYFPSDYPKASDVKSELNKRILPLLNAEDRIELIGERIHVEMDN